MDTTLPHFTDSQVLFIGLLMDARGDGAAAAPRIIHLRDQSRPHLTIVLSLLREVIQLDSESMRSDIVLSLNLHNEPS